MKKRSIVLGLVVMAVLALPLLVVTGFLTLTLARSGTDSAQLAPPAAGYSVLRVGLEGDLPAEETRTARRELKGVIESLYSNDSNSSALRLSGEKSYSADYFFTASAKWEFSFQTPENFDVAAFEGDIRELLSRRIPGADLTQLEVISGPVEGEG